MANHESYFEYEANGITHFAPSPISHEQPPVISRVYSSWGYEWWDEYYRENREKPIKPSRKVSQKDTHPANTPIQELSESITIYEITAEVTFEEEHAQELFSIEQTPEPIGTI